MDEATTPTDIENQELSAPCDASHADEPVEITETQDRYLNSETIKIVLDFMQHEQIEIKFNGTLQRKGPPRIVLTKKDIASALSHDIISSEWLIDTILIQHQAKGRKIPQSEIVRAFRIVRNDDIKQRRKSISLPLFETLTPPELACAKKLWENLSFIAFETSPDLTQAILQHFIWQVKRKLVGEKVTRHLMPIVFSPIQGGGKTTFVSMFLGPLHELATGPVLFSDFADHRNGDLYRFPAIIIDDMEQIGPTQVPKLKALMTTASFRRRRLGTSYSDELRQDTTLIGTANQPIDELVPDKTGNRRFACLHFRNGEVEKNGDPRVWEVVSETDYTLLWKSVDALACSPIETHLKALSSLQKVGLPPDILVEWLRGLDVEAPAIWKIRNRNGIRAQELYRLFCQQTGSFMSETQFGTRMNHLVADPSICLGDKLKASGGMFYPLKTPAK